MLTPGNLTEHNDCGGCLHPPHISGACASCRCTNGPRVADMNPTVGDSAIDRWHARKLVVVPLPERE